MDSFFAQLAVRPRLTEKRTNESPSDMECEAECALANIVPTSLAGTIGLLEYAATVEQEIGFREIYVEDKNDKRGKSCYYFATRNLVQTLQSLTI